MTHFGLLAHLLVMEAVGRTTDRQIDVSLALAAAEGEAAFTRLVARYQEGPPSIAVIVTPDRSLAEEDRPVRVGHRLAHARLRPLSRGGCGREPGTTAAR